MDKHRAKSLEISNELTRLLAQQADFFKNVSHTAEEISEYKESRHRVRELFAVLAQSRTAA